MTNVVSLESLLLLWTVSNAILIAIGVAALVVSVILAVVSPMSYRNPNVSSLFTRLL